MVQVDIKITLDVIVAAFALIAAIVVAFMQISLMDKQSKIFDRQREISEYQKIYQGQQTTISKQQATLLSQQLAIIEEQEKDRKNKEELYLLIAPLYANLRKDDDIIDWMSRREIDKIWKYRDKPLKEAALRKLEADILEIMRLRKGLAHGSLYLKINAYEKKMPNYGINRSEMKPLLDEIFVLVKNRYSELIGK